MFVSLSKLTPSGRPLTLFVTAWPLLSVASIVIESIAVLTSFVWSLIAVTVGAVLSTTSIVNVVSILFPDASVVVTVIG